MDRAGIARLIPHAGRMCLLDRLLASDAGRIACATESHRDPDNPMRRNGRLGVLCGVEYAAQAMALHGALHGALQAGADAPRGGALAALRDLAWFENRLDLLESSLLIEAVRLHEEEDRVIYGFTLSHAGRTVLEGRAAAVLR